MAHINKLRAKHSIQLAAEGKVALDPYEFDYLLLCNKICGSSHYNMQMKIVVDTPEDYKAWLAAIPTMSQQMKDAAPPVEEVAPVMEAEAPIVVLAN